MAYADGDVLVRAVMESVTGLPEDRVVNDFAFAGTPDMDSTARAAIFGVVSDFYRTPRSTGTSVGSYISNAINRAATHRLDMYAITAGPLGSPIDSIPWLGPDAAGSSKGLPTEAAAVLSYHADFAGAVEESGATRPKSRHRGRLFLGPLHDGALSLTAPYRLHDTLTATMREAAVALMDATSLSGTDTPWCVWSRKDAILRVVTGGWTDNAPDSQRRRGVGPSNRTVWGS